MTSGVVIPFGIIFGALSWLFAAEPTTIGDFSAPITGVTVGGAFVYLLTYHIPKSNREFAKSLEGLTAQCGRMSYLLLLIAVSPDYKNDPAVKKAINDFAVDIGIKRPE